MPKNPTLQENVLSQLMDALQRPPEPMAGPPPIRKGQRLAMALAGTLNPEFRKSFVEPRLAEERGMPAEAQKYRQAQETSKLGKGLTLLDLLGQQAKSQAESQQKADELTLKKADVRRKNFEANSRADLNKAHAEYYRAVAKRDPSGKANPLYAALDKQVAALQKYSDSLTKSFDISGEEIPANVASKKIQIQGQIEGLLSRMETVLRTTMPDALGNTPNPFEATPEPEEDFFGEGTQDETGGI